MCMQAGRCWQLPLFSPMFREMLEEKAVSLTHLLVAGISHPAHPLPRCEEEKKARWIIIMQQGGVSFYGVWEVKQTEGGKDEI